LQLQDDFEPSNECICVTKWQNSKISSFLSEKYTFSDENAFRRVIIESRWRRQNVGITAQCELAGLFLVTWLYIFVYFVASDLLAGGV